MRHGCDGLRGVGHGGGDRGRGRGRDGLHVHRVSVVGMDGWSVLNVVVNLVEGRFMKMLCDISYHSG